MNLISIENPTESFDITASMIRQYLFCPRIPFYQLTRNLPLQKPQWVREGEKQHETMEQLFKRRHLERFGINDAKISYRFKVYSKKMRIQGIVDCLLRNNENSVCPIEFKLSCRRPEIGQILQLSAYMFCLEEMGYDVLRGFLCSIEHKKIHEVKKEKEYFNKIQFIRENIYQDFEKGLLPDSSVSMNKCYACEFLRFCNDRK